MSENAEVKREKERFDALMKHMELKNSGYAGIDRNGNIVDRRENPDAVPLQKNSMMGIPDPKKI